MSAPPPTSARQPTLVPAAHGASPLTRPEDRLAELLGGFQVDSASRYPIEAQQAAFLARVLMRRASELQTPQEKRQQAELDRMMQNPQDKVTLMQLTDQAFRSNAPHRAADQLVHILDAQGVPRFFAPVDRLLLKGFQSFGSYLPGVAIPLVKEKMHQETANVILPAERELLTLHLRERRSEGVRMNVNYLGEALLGEKEAQRRLERYLAALQLPEIEVLSVKISTIYSQLSSIASEASIAVLCDRLELLYRAAAKARFHRTDGTSVPKFVYLDMEEYRDMHLTAEAFRRTLDRPGLELVTAGIVLQAYIPDAFQHQREITAWACNRVAHGGAPITLRIVKGANMEMERFEACLHGWPQAPFKSKSETDANYRRMVEYGMRTEHLRAVKLGIASHNLFEVAYGLVLAARHGSFEHLQFEMLEGMANHQRRSLLELASNLLLYAPACRREEFINAIGYLVRRLDENTGPDNFLRHAFRLSVDSEEWERLERQFLEAFDRIPTLPDEPRRTQNRATESDAAVVELSVPDTDWQGFDNEPDTDFALIPNVRWAERILSTWEPRHSDQATRVPLHVAGDEITESRRERQNTDPSRPGLIVSRYREANAEDIDRAVDCAKEDPDGWRAMGIVSRQNILRHVAAEIRKARGDLMGAAVAEGGKILSESDPEVSEAVDFVEFYSKSAAFFANLPGLATEPRGVVVVVSPWNFPIAIPCGGIAAALAAGNTVILKPASHTVLIAHLLCECFWRAGVSKRTLQLLPCAGATEGERLVTHPDVDTVILTGGTDTALAMLARKPELRLFAETGGKNATIVSSLSDRDQVIKNVLHSAFSHSGQKCSATSLLVLEDEVFRDEGFRETLDDAVSSLEVGSAWDLKTKVGPLIRPPSGALEKGLLELEEGESWAVMPRRHGKNPQLYSPGVKWNTRPGSFTHLTEFFGPVLAVIRASHLAEAIEIVNGTGYGLTSGLESLDDRERSLWMDRIRAGNLYINRGTTGAIVLRQPFGGMGKSAFGPGNKAGGPNYVAQFMRFRETGDPDLAEPRHDPQLSRLRADLIAESSRSTGPFSPLESQSLLSSLGSYSWEFSREFHGMHDHARLLGQDNYRRYLPVKELRVRVERGDNGFEIVARVFAAKTVGCRITVSTPPDFTSPVVDWLDEKTADWGAAIEFVEEDDEALAEAIRTGQTFRVRYAGPQRVPLVVRRAANGVGLYLADAPVLRHGRVELLWYVEEQSISDNYHRYGNLGSRNEESRREPT